MVEQWNSVGGTLIVEQVKRRWWNSVVEQWNSDGGTVIVKQCGGKVEQCGGTVLVEQWNSDAGTV